MVNYDLLSVSKINNESTLKSNFIYKSGFFSPFKEVNPCESEFLEWTHYIVQIKILPGVIFCSL